MKRGDLVTVALSGDFGKPRPAIVVQTDHVQFTDINVASDLETRKEMIEKSGQMGVPVITIGSDLVVGFDEGRLKELLAV